jgi:hypothetical protein
LDAFGDLSKRESGGEDGDGKPKLHYAVMSMPEIQEQALEDSRFPAARIDRSGLIGN